MQIAYIMLYSYRLISREELFSSTFPSLVIVRPVYSSWPKLSSITTIHTRFNLSLKIVHTTQSSPSYRVINSNVLNSNILRSDISHSSPSRHSSFRIHRPALKPISTPNTTPRLSIPPFPNHNSQIPYTHLISPLSSPSPTKSSPTQNLFNPTGRFKPSISPFSLNRTPFSSNAIINLGIAAAVPFRVCANGRLDSSLVGRYRIWRRRD